jgi:hypothetical protein
MNRVLHLVRYVLPAGIVIAAVIAVIAGGASDTALEGAAMLAGAGLAIFLLNTLYRMGVSGDTERDREEAARRYFDEYGRWPDQVV